MRRNSQFLGQLRRSRIKGDAVWNRWWKRHLEARPDGWLLDGLGLAAHPSVTTRDNVWIYKKV